MLEDDIFALLSTDASIQSAMGGQNNVYVGYVPKGSQISPSLVIQIPATTRLKGSDGTNALTMKRVQVDCRHVMAGVARKMGEAVIALLKDLSGSLPTTNVQGVIPGKEMDMPIEPGDSGYVARRLTDFDFWFYDGAGSVPYTPIAPTALGANAGYIEGIPVSAAAPADGQALFYNATAGKWQPGNLSTSGARPLTISGTLNGVNPTFTLSGAPGSILFPFKNGQYLRINDDYSINGLLITFVIPPKAGDNIDIYTF
jgi:hypothetical protein